VLQQPGGFGWLVYDERVHADALKFADYLEVEASGAVRWADSVQDLAEAIEAPTGRVESSFANVDRIRSGELEDSHGRRDWGGEPLTAPYAFAKITGALFHTQGGLRVDKSARVLSEGSPISGLYAAGGAAAGISGHGAQGYLSGNGLLSALGLGLIAGRHAAQAAV
jgi:fumarate reductase flavoprotein subunit